MKKVLLSGVLFSFLAVSCGPSICDCVKTGEEMEKEMENLEDFSKAEEIMKKYEDKLKKCEELAEGMSEDEVTEAVEACK